MPGIPVELDAECGRRGGWDDNRYMFLRGVRRGRVSLRCIFVARMDNEIKESKEFWLVLIRLINEYLYFNG